MARGAGAKGTRKRSASDGAPKKVLALRLGPTCRPAPSECHPNLLLPPCAAQASRKKKDTENTAPQLSEYEKERAQSCANASCPHTSPSPC